MFAISVVDDGQGGKYASCAEVPQVYGWGETEKDASDMLKREIYSLYTDIKDCENLTDEYKKIKEIIKEVSSWQ